MVVTAPATGGLNWLTREQVAIIYHSIAGEDQQAGISAGEDLSICFGFFRCFFLLAPREMVR